MCTSFDSYISLTFYILNQRSSFYASLGAIFADCFVKEPSKRIEIGQLLNHEFFEENATSNVTMDSTVCSTTISQPNVSRATNEMARMDSMMQFMTPGTQQKVRKAMKRAEEGQGR